MHRRNSVAVSTCRKWAPCAGRNLHRLWEHVVQQQLLPQSTLLSGIALHVRHLGSPDIAVAAAAAAELLHPLCEYLGGQH